MSFDKPLRVLLVDDHELVRDGIRARLELESDFKVIGEACDGEKALLACNELQPDIVMIDISMPRMNGLEATKEIRQSHPNIKILVLSMYENPEYVQGLIRAGAHGYILKDISSAEMIQAIKSVAMGGVYFSSKVAPNLLQPTSAPTPDCAVTAPPPLGPSSGPERVIHDPYKLTSRELEVLAFIAQGYANKEIAKQLSISVRTAETHRQNVRQKTGGGNAADLARIASELGLI